MGGKMCLGADHGDRLIARDSGGTLARLVIASTCSHIPERRRFANLCCNATCMPRLWDRGWPLVNPYVSTL